MLGVRALLLKSRLGRERREEGQLAGWVGVRGGRRRRARELRDSRAGNVVPGGSPVWLSSGATWRAALSLEEPKANAGCEGVGDWARRREAQ